MIPDTPEQIADRLSAPRNDPRREQICEHGIRWPWECDDCSRRDWEAHKAALATQEDKG